MFDVQPIHILAGFLGAYAGFVTALWRISAKRGEQWRQRSFRYERIAFDYQALAIKECQRVIDAERNARQFRALADQENARALSFCTEYLKERDERLRWERVAAERAGTNVS